MSLRDRLASWTLFVRRLARERNLIRKRNYFSTSICLALGAYRTLSTSSGACKFNEEFGGYWLEQWTKDRLTPLKIRSPEMMRVVFTFVMTHHFISDEDIEQQYAPTLYCNKIQC